MTKKNRDSFFVEENADNASARRKQLVRFVIVISIVQAICICAVLAFMPVRENGALIFSYAAYLHKKGEIALDIFSYELIALVILTSVPLFAAVLSYSIKNRNGSRS